MKKDMPGKCSFEKNKAQGVVFTSENYISR
jgi:hypothetical protein